MGRILRRDELILHVAQEKRNGRRIVFANGCFDLLHPGHLKCLEEARKLGDFLVVAINSDESVRRLKRSGRPLVPQEERAEVLAALEFVDAVVVFNEATPRELIAELLPDVLVKGGDWGPDEIVGREEVEATGGKVVSIPVVQGWSTSEILRRIRAPEASGSAIPRR